MGWQWLAGAAVALGVAVTLLVLALPGRHERRGIPPAVAEVARYARTVLSPARVTDAHPVGRGAPVEVGRPVTVAADGQRIVLRTWLLGGTVAVVAVSDQPFPILPGAAGAAGGAMAWSARLGKLGLCCLNGRPSELAALVPLPELAVLAARLPLA